MSDLTYGTFRRPFNTYMDAEEKAYDGGLTNGSRYGAALCSDGKVRRVKLGIPDTYFSIPASCKVGGKTVSGYVSGPPTALYLWSDAVPEDTLCFYAQGANRSALPEWPERERAAQ